MIMTTNDDDDGKERNGTSFTFQRKLTDAQFVRRPKHTNVPTHYGIMLALLACLSWALSVDV